MLVKPTLYYTIWYYAILPWVCMCVYMSTHLWCPTYVCMYMLVCQTFNTDPSVNFILLIETVYFTESGIHQLGENGQTVPVIWLPLLFYGYWDTTAFTFLLKIKLRSLCLSKHFPHGTFLTPPPVFIKYFVIFYYSPLSEVLRVIPQQEPCPHYRW